MNRFTRSILLVSLAPAFLVGCVHTPPGTSVKVALAKKAELVRLAGTPTVTPVTAKVGGGSSVSDYAPEKTERIADAFSRGEFCLGAGKDDEAIVAFEEVVKIDPHFSDAWVKLASLYEKTGKDKQALEAYKRAKMEGTSHSLTSM